MSAVIKRSVSIRGHRTSFSVEQPFFDLLQKTASERAVPLATLIAEIDDARPRNTNLSSAIRLFILEQAQKHQVRNL